MGVVSELKDAVDSVFNIETSDENFIETFKSSVESKQAEIFAKFLKEDPDKLFAILRKPQPVLKTPKGYVITQFDDVQEALTRNDVFTVGTYAPKMDPSVGPYMLARDDSEINYRDKAMMRTVLRMDDLPKIRKMAAQYANEELQSANGEIEIVNKIARKIPVRITRDYFGFNASEEQLFRWSYATQSDMFHNLTNDALVHAANVTAGQEMKEFLTAELPKRRKVIKAGSSLDDSFSRLVRISNEAEATGFDDERIIANVMGLLVGGVETTSQAIVQILDQLIRVFPEKLAEAKELAKAGDDEKFDAYIWEALRFNPINPFVVRITSQDYILAAGTIRETKIPKGSIALLSTRSAMRDEKQVPDADKFRTDRPKYHYMHFGFGAHECLGKYVGMVEIPEIVKQVILRDDIEEIHPVEFIEPSAFPEKYILGYK